MIPPGSFAVVIEFNWARKSRDLGSVICSETVVFSVHQGFRFLEVFTSTFFGLRGEFGG